MSDWSQTPPRAMRWNSRPRVLAMERPTLVFPTPGGPTKQRMGPWEHRHCLSHLQQRKASCAVMSLPVSGLFVTVVTILIQHRGLMLRQTTSPHKTDPGPESDPGPRKGCPAHTRPRHLQGGLQLPDSQVLQHTLLQLVQGVVVIVQQLASSLDVQAI